MAYHRLSRCAIRINRRMQVSWEIQLKLIGSTFLAACSPIHAPDRGARDHHHPPRESFLEILLIVASVATTKAVEQSLCCKFDPAV
jgi:hypothetical protein